MTVSVGDVVGLLNKQVQLAEQAASRRKRWHNTTKSLIRQALTEITNHRQVDSQTLFVEANPIGESVYLKFYDGQIDTERNGTVGIARIGACICYSLLGNGMVFVWHSFPYVENKEKQRLHKPIATLPPHDITEEGIWDHVSQFLTNINGVEQSSPEAPDYESLNPKPQKPPIPQP